MEQHDDRREGTIRPCVEDDIPQILQIINAAAIAYRDVIPADRWHDPYMPAQHLRKEIAAGVHFIGYVMDGTLVGVMGIQQVRNVRLIRHAYVLPERQGHGIGSKLLGHLRGSGEQPILIGTWATACWAIRFYQRHGFELVPRTAIAPLLRSYWNVPDRQIETSVVLASPALSSDQATRMIGAA